MCYNVLSFELFIRRRKKATAEKDGLPFGLIARDNNNKKKTKEFFKIVNNK